MAERVVVSLTASATREPDLETAYRVLYAMALARRNGAVLVLVLDDRGQERAGVARELAWAGLEWDGASPGGDEGTSAVPGALPDLEERFRGRALSWFRERGILPQALLQCLGHAATATVPLERALPLPEVLDRLGRGELRSGPAPFTLEELERLDALHGRSLHDALIPPGRTDTNTAALLRQARDTVAGEGARSPAALAARLSEVALDADWSEAELLAVLGRAVSVGACHPAPPEGLCALGKATSIERLDAAIDVLGDPENPILGESRHPA
jgi:hypothetical protein